jgi:hypothetical protein
MVRCEWVGYMDIVVKCRIIKLVFVRCSLAHMFLHAQDQRRHMLQARYHTLTKRSRRNITIVIISVGIRRNLGLSYISDAD